MSLLYLSPFVFLIDGERDCCIYNSAKGDFIVANKDAKFLLDFFRSGNTLDKFCAHYESDIEVLSAFIDECIKKEVLLHKQIVNNESNSSQKLSFSLTVELTTECNLHCKHCYNNSGKISREFLDLHFLNNLFISLKEEYNELSLLTITGGEPFLYNDLESVISLAIETGFKKIHINSNGTIFPQKHSLLWEELNNYSDIISIQISILGESEYTHDFLTNKKGSFRRTMRNIPLFKKLLPNIKISFLVSKLTQNKKDKALLLSRQFDIPIEFNDNLLLKGRLLINSDDIYLSPDNTSNVCFDNIYNNGNYVRLEENKQFSTLNCFPPKLPCGTEALSISANGDVLPCTLLQGVVIGNLYSQTIKDIINSKSMVVFKKTIDIDNRKICKNCELRYFCSFRCPALSFGQGFALDDKNPNCTYY